MAFWISLLFAVLFAWFAAKAGFYAMWAMLFNLIISVYLAIFLHPTIKELISEIGDAPYDNALTVLAIAVASFLILQAVTFTLFTAHFTIALPKIIDSIGAGFLGLFSGFLVWGFIALLITITPLAQKPFVKEIVFVEDGQQINSASVYRCCNLVNWLVSDKNRDYTTMQMIDGLLKEAEKHREKIPEPAEPIDSPKQIPVETNDA